jgi:hypothetical protein
MLGFGSTVTAPFAPPLIESNLSPEECFGVANSAFVFSRIAGGRAVTDRGTVLGLYRYEALITPSTVSQRRFDVERDMACFLNSLEVIVLERVKRPGSLLERMGPMNAGCNCHGWVFTGGQAGIHDYDVATILSEHCYEAVERPSHGDVAVYRTDGTIIHSGIVHQPSLNQPLLIRSKWGPFGVFAHRPEAHGGEVTYHRTPRWGHQLAMLPAAP